MGSRTGHAGRRGARTLAAVVAGLALAAVQTAFAGPGRPWRVVERVSVASDGTQADGESIAPFITPNGRFVAFSSRAGNLVPGDTNGQRDAFVHDRRTGRTARVSVASDGTEGNGDSTTVGISADGRFVTVGSSASNLVAGDTNAVNDVFLHDRRTGRTTRVSVASDGTQGDRFSGGGTLTPDGRFVGFQSGATNLVPGDTNGVRDEFVHDRQTGQTTRVSMASDGTQANGDSLSRSLSADGRFAAFFSLASNLVPGDTNGTPDVFLHDRQTGQTTRVSVASDGSQADDRCGFGFEVISAGGRFVTFPCLASNLVAGDTNGAWDVFVHDRGTGATTRVNVTSDGAQSAGDEAATAPFSSISKGGRFVVFRSGAGDLVDGDTNGVRDTFVHDRRTGRTSRVSVAADGTQGDGHSESGLMTRRGRLVAFYSAAGNLVDGDTNGVYDIFIARRTITPAEAVEDLIEEIGDMGLPHGIAGVLAAQLETRPACVALRAFIQEVEGLQRAGSLTAEQAASLLEAGHDGDAASCR